MEELLPSDIQAIIFDFDGVFTDNRVITDEDGKEFVICDRSDGLGISALKKYDLCLLVLSKEKNPVVLKRCEKMGISCVNGIDDKKSFLANWLKERSFDPSNAIYVGNDINDIDCMQFVGCGVAVADAFKNVKQAAKLVLKKPGGCGAVRELCDLVITKICTEESLPTKNKK